MKRLGLTVLLLLILAACSSSPKWEISIEKAPIYYAQESSTFVVQVTESGKPITGLRISAILEMERMDHGQITVQLEDQGEGIYAGLVALPMGGDWLAAFDVSNGKQMMEKVLHFTVAE